jgi:hypothetical protein
MVERDDDRHEPDDFDIDAPPTEEEVAASKRLRDALEGASSGGEPPSAASPEVELALALRAAWEPAALSIDESRAVLDATASAEEQAFATLLRDALADRREPRAADHADIHLARALRNAFSPTALDEAEHRAMVEAAVAKMPAQALREGGAKVVHLEPRAARARVVRIAFGFVSGGLALAASIVLVVTSAPVHGTEAPLAKARSTQPLFSEPFKPGETSARIDRIASARASDFRDNRFTKWGVR